MRNVPTATHWVPEQLWQTWKKFVEIARREGRSAGEILNEFIANYVRIHEPGNPQWPLDRFQERPQEQPPSSGKPMPDYAKMTDQELLRLLGGPTWKLGGFERMLVKHILKRRGLALSCLDD